MIQVCGALSLASVDLDWTSLTAMTPWRNKCSMMYTNQWLGACVSPTETLPSPEPVTHLAEQQMLQTLAKSSTPNAL